MIEDTVPPPAVPCRYCGGECDSHSICQSCGCESDERIGLVLEDRYEVQSLIGAGGMGRVYRGRHTVLGESVAIKFLLRSYSTTAEMRIRFRREAVVLSKLRHPGIVSVLDFGDHDGELYMVMEMLEGTPLCDVMGVKTPMPIGRLGDIFDQVLQVIESAHAAGVAHRDLKPDNVMLVRLGDRVDRVKVLDFGLALVEGTIDRLTVSGAALGTPYYMSPEQCRGENVGAATDIYAIGVMLFEALTGVLPFQAQDVSSLMSQQMFVKAPSLAEAAPGRTIPAGLQAVVTAAMSKRQAVRPTAGELRDMLASAIRGTDAVALAATAALAREHAAGLSRSERGITRPTQPELPDVSETISEDVVVLWATNSARLTRLRDTLAVNQLSPRIVTSDALPDGETIAMRAIVVMAEPDGAARTRRVRDAGSKVPVLVIESVDVKQTLELIRAGANDATPVGTDDSAIFQSIKRLLRRKR